ncbi:MAG: heme ABC transporter permease [Kangiellaceae bacterium]|nr:heme ABC transporter permease [Kangiellaceae bacterium]|tara:strand:+ start:5543 stop:6283 length:741 start_codon:yes stop_codon:yes gene_type:complete
MWQWFHKLGSPKYVYPLCGKLLPWMAFFTTALLVIGTVWGLFYAPADYQQGNSFRIIYIHVPSAFMSMGTYTYIAVLAAIGIIWRMKLADMFAVAIAPIGAAFTFVALFTGAVWGKPTWGTYWVWDARLTSELILLFLYFGLIALYHAIEDKQKAIKAFRILALVGVVNVPIIHYSVHFWNTLHQGATLSKFEKPSMAPEMLWPLLINILGTVLLFLTIGMMRLRNHILVSEKNTQWVKQEVQHVL